MTYPNDSRENKPTRWAILLAVGLFFLLFGALGLSGRSGWNPVVSVSERTAENVATASVGVYISLRAINAALSTAQEIEVGASVVGQASLQPLKALEPVDDTVERVAAVVFLVAAGAALAAVGLAPVVSVGLVVLGAGLIGKVGAQRSPNIATTLNSLCDKGIAFGLTIAFAIPLLFSLGVWVGERATAAQMSAAVTELDAVAQQANILIGADTFEPAESSDAEDADASILDSMKSLIAGVRDGVGGIFEQSGRYLDAAQVFIDEADTILASSLTIVGIFTLRMLVLPIILLYGALSLLRAFPRQSA